MKRKLNKYRGFQRSVTIFYLMTAPIVVQVISDSNCICKNNPMFRI